MTTPDIPLLDIALWRDGTGRQRERLASRMDQALQESGFLLIENHGVPAGLRDRIRDEARGFFGLPPARKARYATPVGGRGWIPQGGEANAFYGEVADPARADLKESLTIGRDFRARATRRPTSTGSPPTCGRRSARRWRACARICASQVRDLYYDLLRMSAVALGLAEDWFVNHARRAPHTFNVDAFAADRLRASTKRPSCAWPGAPTGAVPDDPEPAVTGSPPTRSSAQEVSRPKRPATSPTRSR